MKANIYQAIAIALALALTCSATLSAQQDLITDANGNAVFAQQGLVNDGSDTRIQTPSPFELPPTNGLPQAVPAVTAPGEFSQWAQPNLESYPQIPSGSVIVPDERIPSNAFPPRYNPAQQYARPQALITPRVSPILPLPPAFIPKLGFSGRIIDGYGMEVTFVRYGSVAQAIGLEAGDVIVKIDGQPVHCVTDYETALQNAATHGGGQVDLVVRNVRYRPGCSINPKFVQLHANLPRVAFTSTVAAREIREH